MPTRRQFIHSTGILTAGLCTAAHAIPPIKRDGPPAMKLSCAAYSFRNALTGKAEPKMTLDDFIDRCAEWKLDGTELTSYYFPKEVTDQYLDHLKEKAAGLGIAISGTAVGNNFCLPPGGKRDGQIAHVKKWVDYAERMEAPTIRIFAGNAAKGVSAEQAREWTVACIEDCCRYAAEHGVTLGLENHGGATSTADGLLAIVEAVDAPAFGVNLDTGNFRTEDPYGDLERVAPYAVSVQVKVEIAPKGGTRQEADFDRLVGLLRKANYQGWVALEYEAKPPPLTAVPQYLAKLRKAMV